MTQTKTRFAGRMKQLVPRLCLHDVHILCQGSSVGQEGICSVFYLLVFGIVHHFYTSISKLRSVSNTPVQATPGVGSVNFWSFTVAWTGWGGGPVALLRNC